ncbi:MAG: metallophosphoesterase [Lentisphaerae bacterium]|nr:metallophosphoesterase [Lentisphaerota bacterium]
MSDFFPAVSSWNCRLFSAADIPAGAIPDGEKLFLSDGSEVIGEPVFFDEYGCCDLHDFTGAGLRSPEVRHILTADFTVTDGGKAVLGCGNDWKMRLFLNDREIFNSLEYGNAEYPVSASNHKILVDLLSGKNSLRAEVFFGGAGAQIAFNLEKYAAPQLKYGPYLLYPDSYSGEITIAFATTFPVPAAVEYRKGGERQWHTVYDNLGGKIRRNAPVHLIRLKNLECDCQYEYRAKLIDTAQNYAELPQESRFLVIPGRKCCFTATGDLQLPALRKDMLKQSIAQTPDAGFFAFLGDLCWVGDFDRNVIGDFTELFREVSGGTLPLVMVRGNHEYYGHDSDRYFEYFSMPEPGEDSYGIFRIGEVCFFILDCGDDSPRRPAPSVWMLHDIEPFLEAEAKWLATAIEHPMCRTAKYRVVFCHGIPLGDPLEYLPGHVRKLIDPFFAGKDPVCKIHLFIGGHVHYPFRSFPGENCCRTALPEALHGHPANGEKYYFPVITVSGPRENLPDGLEQSGIRVQMEREMLEVVSFDRTGREYDRIEILPDGSVTEISSSEFFQKHYY